MGSTVIEFSESMQLHHRSDRGNIMRNSREEQVERVWGTVSTVGLTSASSIQASMTRLPREPRGKRIRSQTGKPKFRVLSDLQSSFISC